MLPEIVQLVWLKYSNRPPLGETVLLGAAVGGGEGRVYKTRSIEKIGSAHADLM